MKIRVKYLKVVGLVVLLGLMFGAGWLTQARIKREETTVTEEQKNKYVVFTNEVFTKIQKNYWEKISDKDLAKVFGLAVEKLSGQAQPKVPETKEDVESLVEDVLASVEEEKKKEFVAQMTDMVLANLEPFGRSRLYAKKDEKALSDTVRNVTEEDYFGALGVKKDATEEEIKQAFDKKVAELEPKADESTEAARQLAEAQQAFKVLGDTDAKKNYEEKGIDPTFDQKLIDGRVLYLHLTKFSPTTLEEFAKIAEKYDKGSKLDGLIWDLRGNVGGAIDGLPYFLGPFLGPDTWAYQFYHQGEKEDYKTKTGWLPSLVRYKKVVVLIDSKSQSTAEVMAAAMKKYNVGVVMGETSKGWGTVERVFSLENQISDEETYSMFLVHSLTLRDDGKPIEGNGVEPVIDTNNAGWQAQLRQYFESEVMIKAVEEVL